MSPESFNVNITIVKYLYRKTMASLFFSRWVLTIVGCLSIILAVQDLTLYNQTQALPLTDNMIVLGMSVIVAIYMLHRIRIATICSIRLMHDLATLTAYLELKNQQLNNNIDNIDDFIDTFGNELDKEIKNRYGINL